MNPGSPWLSDMRVRELGRRFTRDGFPAVQSCRLRKYRSFTLRAAIVACTALALYEALQSTVSVAAVEKQQKGGGPTLLKMSRVAHLRYNEGAKHRGVIILTRHRSGSSFFSQLFNQRPDVFYLYEPLIPFGYGCDPPDDPLRIQHLRKLLRCEYPDHKELNVELGSRKKSDEKTTKLCVDNNVCFREKMRRMCTKDLCGVHYDTCRNCKRVSSSQASSMCHKSHLTAIKVIRLCQLESLKPLLEDPDMDVKVLHLVRDPRGIFSSREKLAEPWQHEAINDTCNKTQAALKVGFEPANSWLDGRYKVVRYEDLCRRPLQVAREVYNFVGLRMTSSMEKWIVSNTAASLANLGDVRAVKVAHKVGGKRAKTSLLRDAIVSDPYTTTRNSSAVWRAWREQLDVTRVRQVQAGCEQVMEALQYVKVREQWQLDESQFHVLGSICSQRVLPRCRVLDLLLQQN